MYKETPLSVYVVKMKIKMKIKIKTFKLCCVYVCFLLRQFGNNKKKQQQQQKCLLFKAYKVLLDNVFDCIKGFLFFCFFFVFVMDLNLIFESLI